MDNESRRSPITESQRTRRSGLAGLALLSLVTCTAPPTASRARQSDTPNIVLIVADDLGWGELGSYGQSRISTPHLDRMAREGMRLTQFYAGAPVCAPSRCVLMTGLDSTHATIRDNEEVQPEGQAPIYGADQTIAEVLDPAGYTSGCFGKWGLGYPGSEGDPLAQGFERFYGYNCQRHAHNFYPRYLWNQDRKVTLAGNDRGITGKQYSHDLIEGAALDFIRDNRGGPFFCYVPFTIPHLALQVPQESLAEYSGRWDEAPYSGKSYLPHAEPRAAYAAMIGHMDRSVGRILALLSELDLEKDTLVLFTSDNGPTHLEAQVDCQFFDSTAGLRGLKGSVFEGGLRVPLIARWPGRIPADSVSAHISAFQDLLPTLAEVARQPAPRDLDGISFLPTLLGEAEQAEHEALRFDFPGYGGQQAVRSGRWKAVRRGLKRDPDARWELYDLETDPAESKDLASERPKVVAELAERIEEPG